jgi:DNA gyrase subunit A
LQTTDRNGTTVAALQVTAGQEIMLISSTGTLVRTGVDQISVVGRNTQGVRLIRLAEGERLSGIERIETLEGEVVENGNGSEEVSAASGASAEGDAAPPPESTPDETPSEPSEPTQPE